MTDQPEKPDYGDTLEAQIIADMVSDGITLIKACRDLGISHTGIYAKINGSAKFAAMMETAREAGYDVIADGCFDIADDTTSDMIEVETRNGPKIVVDREHIQRSKLRIETRLKLLAKWHPKRYGEKLQVETKSANVQIPISDDPVEAAREYEKFMKGG